MAVIVVDVAPWRLRTLTASDEATMEGYLNYRIRAIALAAVVLAPLAPLSTGVLGSGLQSATSIDPIPQASWAAQASRAARRPLDAQPAAPEQPCPPSGGPGCAIHLTDIALHSPNEGWVVGDGGYIARFDSGALTPVASPTTERIEAVAAVSADVAWAVGRGIFRYADGAWSVAVPGDDVAGKLLDVDFYSPDAGWAVGEGGRVMRFDAGAWAPDVVPVDVWEGDGAIVAIDVPAVDVAWAVAGDGSVLRFADDQWTLDDVVSWSTFHHPRAITMSSPTEGWIGGTASELPDAVARQPLLYRRGAEGWEAMPELPGFPLLADYSGITALTATEDVVWAAADSGGLLRYAGGAWSWLNAPLGPSPSSLAVVSSDEAWAVGDASTVLQQTGGCWQRVGGPRLVAGAAAGAFTSLIWQVHLPALSGGGGDTPLERLTDSPIDEWQPALSPDGRVLAYVAVEDGRHSALHVRDACGNAHDAWPSVDSSPPDDTVQYATKRREAPSFFPDGHKLAHAVVINASNVDEKDRASIAEIIPDGRHIEHIVRSSAASGHQPLHPSVSPDGRWLAYDADAEEPPGNDIGSEVNREIYLMELATREATRLTDHPAADRQPTFAPDGRTLLFTSSRDGNSEIYRIGVDGGGLERITEHPSADAWASLSRDGRTLVFQSDRTPGNGVYALDLVTGTTVRLTSRAYRALTPRVAPDGRSVIFAADVHGQFDIFRMALP